MSVILCRKEQVSHPYFLEVLGVNVSTSQELCYAIYHHPLLAMDGFVNENLIEFIREELKMGFTALKMERWMKSGENPDEMIFIFLQECDYYTTVEINKLRQQVTALRKLPSMEYAKRKADYLVGFKQYGKAIAGYEKILENMELFKTDDRFAGKVWNNLGACYARVFQFEKAMKAFGHGYDKLKDEGILEKMYHLTVLSPELELKEQYQQAVSEEQKVRWDADLEEARKQAGSSPEKERLEELFQKDPIKRMEGAAKLVENWKQEYRGMA